jgi:dTDP-4-dehydrorhamnose reductase
MKIAVLGSNGFVGSKISQYFSNYHQVVPATRQTINLLDPGAVLHWLKENKFDIVINAAATMQDDHALHDTRNNLGLFMNLYNNRNLNGTN